VKKIVILLILILVSILPFQVYGMTEARSSVYGKVIDNETGEPLHNLTIFINIYDVTGKKDRVKTDSDGLFAFKNIPAQGKEYLYQIDVRVDENDFPSRNYYKQRYEIFFRLYEGKNLYLDPVKIKRGIRVTGSIKLWNGSVINKGRILFHLKNKKDLNSINSSWNCDLNSDDGRFISPNLPFDIELKVIADYLRNEDLYTAYGKQIRIIKINKNQDLNSLNIIIPNTKKEVEGIVTDFNGVPLGNQLVSIEPTEIEIKTDAQGRFKFMCLSISEFRLELRYKKQNIIKRFNTGIFSLNNNTKLFVNIKVDSANFQYKVSYQLYKN